MIAVADPFMAGIRPSGLQKGRGGFLRSADDAPYVTDPTGEVCKTGDRKGEVKRLKYGSPSNRGREIENDAGLVKYKQRLSLLGIGMEQSLAVACTHLADLPIGSPEFNSAADSIVVAADRITRSSLAADRGTHGHLLCELWDDHEDDEAIRKHYADGEAVGLTAEQQTYTVDAWANMLSANGLEVLAIEASCVDDTWRLAGTLDRIVRTTKPLTFVKPGGELVTIPAGTVLILDIKFGKCRKAHPIQIASYAQSVSYDTDTETRGVWPWPIDQTHALIAHGDFGGDGKPVSIELVWVDLVAGREHGGQCVVDAKSWAARDDVFSVAQIVEGAVTDGTLAYRPSPSTPLTDGTPSPSVSTGEVEACGTLPETSPVMDVEGAGGESQCTETEAVASSLAPSTHTDATPSPSVSVAQLEVSAHGSGSTLAGETSDLVGAHFDSTTQPDRLALVDARSILCATPDEGADWSTPEFDPLWHRLRSLFDCNLPPAARTWRRELASQAQRRGVSFMAQEGMTERRYHINKGLIALAIVDPDDDILRAILALVLGDIAWFVGIEPGHLVGSLSAAEAAKFADHVDVYISPPGGDAA